MSRASRLNPTELSVIGIDIGKDVFHIIGFDPSGTIVLRRKIKRMALVATFERLPRCIVGLEACSARILSVARCASSALSLGSFQPSTQSLS